MAVVLGADGCPGNGWVVAAVDGPRVSWHHVVGAAALLRLAAELSAVAVAVDVPIGLPETGARACDLLARERLGPRRASVFPAPPRSALAHLTYAAARPSAPSMSAQTFALVARIRDVDGALRSAGPTAHRQVFECHPEVAFRVMTGRVLPSKKSAPGALLRLAALQGQFGDLPPDAPVSGVLDDALDALACAWSALRWSRGQAEVLGGDLDPTGVPMRIVV